MKGNQIFLSSCGVKIDEKKRFMIPSSFRKILEMKGAKEIYAFSSFINSCVEVCTVERINKFYEFLENMEMFSPQRDAIATAVLADCESIQIDSRGRIMLPDRLMEFANLKEEALFVGKGLTFEIWNRDNFDNYYKKAKEIAKNSSFMRGRVNENPQ